MKYKFVSVIGRISSSFSNNNFSIVSAFFSIRRYFDKELLCNQEIRKLFHKLSKTQLANLVFGTILQANDREHEEQLKGLFLIKHSFFNEQYSIILFFFQIMRAADFA